MVKNAGRAARVFFGVCESSCLRTVEPMAILKNVVLKNKYGDHFSSIPTN